MTGPAGPRRSSADAGARRVLWIVGVAMAAMVLTTGAAIIASGSPQVCGACHEMQPAVATWRVSPHAQVGCPACHEPPQPVYSAPATLVWRAGMLRRDLAAHDAAKASTTPTMSFDTTSTIPDANCLQCHEMRTITSPAGLLIDHTKHVERNKSCVSCHLWTAHPAPDAEAPLLFMARCFQCHGRTPGSKAPGTCTTCHPPGFSARPASHTTGNWRTEHGKAALAHRQPCSMCHETSFCNNCHGLQMPHPADWVKGNPGHSTVGANNRALCARCHTQKPDLCSMCHHEDFGPTKGPWLLQHPAMVDKRGAAFCMQCHDSVFCTDCHSKRTNASQSATQ